MIDCKVCRGEEVPAQGCNPASLGVVEEEVDQTVVGNPRTIVGNIDVWD
jgi:hypothetical protein